MKNQNQLKVQKMAKVFSTEEAFQDLLKSSEINPNTIKSWKSRDKKGLLDESAKWRILNMNGYTPTGKIAWKLAEEKA